MLDEDAVEVDFEDGVAEKVDLNADASKRSGVKNDVDRCDGDVEESNDEEHFDEVGENAWLFVFAMACAQTIWARARTIGLCGVVVSGLVPSML